MYKEREFIERLKKRGQDPMAIDVSVSIIAMLEKWLIDAACSLERPDLAAVEAWIAANREDREGIDVKILTSARYFNVTGEIAITIRLLAYLLPIGVLPSMAERLVALEGEDLGTKILNNLEFPTTGAPPEDYPAATARFVLALQEELGEDRARKVLAWNVHGIPRESFLDERERLRELGSIDEWLLDYHMRQVEILRQHARDKTLWYEQKITQEVIDFIEPRPEIMSGVRVENIIYMTKIPYDPDRYLRATDRLEKRRLACHCPLAASSITAETAGVPGLWCSCSAGYTKFRFDVVFGVETEAEVLESVLSGGDLCRFAIKIPASVLSEMKERQ